MTGNADLPGFVQKPGFVYQQSIKNVLQLKYGATPAGWGPRQRQRFGYCTPDDIYEATVAGLLVEGCRWLDVGCGRDIFPGNPSLARVLASRCSLVAGVDPSENIYENALLHERARTSIDDFQSNHRFNLITMRMVAEHITNPGKTVRALQGLIAPGGAVLVFTVNKWSPVSMASAIIPFRLHHTFKTILWDAEERDTFPTAYKMNTRRELRRLFTSAGFRERHFEYLDDCRTTCNFRRLNWLELQARRMFRAAGFVYPENCLLGIYQSPETASEANAFR
jgi:2-polyprenyl-3-methyl-5-hydroxy-6-metoxy-1,4-benzoquinol methylase